MAKILVGCDPEVFVKKNNKFLSAFGLIQGDKRHPQPVPNGAVQVDGMALEFNINPASNEDQFVYSVQSVFDQLCKMVPDYEVAAVPVAHFDPEYMKVQPKEALELGCDPDFNSWNGFANKRPDGDRPMRTASGHVHIGWTENQETSSDLHRNRCHLAGQQMDFYLGLGSIFYDEDTQRREMYGKGGCIRYKPYGVEYRTLSNAWLQNEQRMRWVYRNVIKGMTDLMSGKILAHKYGDIQEIINTSDKKKAMEIIKDAGLELCNG